MGHFKSKKPSLLEWINNVISLHKKYSLKLSSKDFKDDLLEIFRVPVGDPFVGTGPVSFEKQMG